MKFDSALNSKLAQLKETIEVGDVKTFCNSVIGTNYGEVEFISNPDGASIFVDNDEQDKKTNVKMKYPTGSYVWRIQFDDKKECSGDIKVEADKAHLVTVNIEDCK